MPRPGGRAPDELRPVTITPHYLDFAEGSALITWGRTRVLCATNILEQVPAFRQATGGGWVTAGYAMLPRATPSRQLREGLTGQVRGRSQEIQRLIGRSLRAVVDLQALGARTVLLDCDVLQADGGTRAAAVTGAGVALCLALATLRRRGILADWPVRDLVAGVSVGVVQGELLLDLEYAEDSRAAVDAAFIATGRGELVEVQATGEERPFPVALLQEMLDLAIPGLRELTRLQEEVLKTWLSAPW